MNVLLVSRGMVLRCNQKGDAMRSLFLGLLAVAGLVAFAGESQAFGRRSKCGQCTAPVVSCCNSPVKTASVPVVPSGVVQAAAVAGPVVVPQGSTCVNGSCSSGVVEGPFRRFFKR